MNSKGTMCKGASIDVAAAFLVPLCLPVCIRNQRALGLNEEKEGVQCMLVHFFARKAAWLKYFAREAAWLKFFARKAAWLKTCRVKKPG